MGWLGTAVNTIFPGVGGYVEGALGGSSEEESIRAAGRQSGEAALRLGGVQASATKQAIQRQIGGLQQGQARIEAAQPGVRGAYESAIGSVSPFAAAGRGALGELQSASMQQASPLTQQQLLQTPGVQFRLGEAQKALERGASARGMLLSGGHQRELGRYMQELASQEYGAETERRRLSEQDRLRALQSLSQSGLAAAGTEAQAFQSLGQLHQQQAGTQAAFDQELASAEAEKLLRPHEIRVQSGLQAAGASQLGSQLGAQASQNQRAGMLQSLGTVGGAVLGGPIGGAIASQFLSRPQQVQPTQRQSALVG